MRKIKNELDELVYEQYGDELNAKDYEINKLNESINKLNKTNSQLNKTNSNYREQIKKLSELDGLTPEARKIINALMLL